MSHCILLLLTLWCCHCSLWLVAIKHDYNTIIVLYTGLLTTILYMWYILLQVYSILWGLEYSLLTCTYCISHDLNISKLKKCHWLSLSETYIIWKRDIFWTRWHPRINIIFRNAYTKSLQFGLHLEAAINKQLILCEICERHILCVSSLKEAKILNILIPHIFV